MNKIIVYIFLQLRLLLRLSWSYPKRKSPKRQSGQTQESQTQESQTQESQTSEWDKRQSGHCLSKTSESMLF